MGHGNIRIAKTPKTGQITVLISSIIVFVSGMRALHLKWKIRPRAPRHIAVPRRYPQVRDTGSSREFARATRPRRGVPAAGPRETGAREYTVFPCRQRDRS